MSFHGLVETAARSACLTRDPSCSRRSTWRSADETTSSRPSGRKSMHMGNDFTSASTMGALPDATEKTRPAPQSESHNRPSRQRGDSPNTMPSISTSTGGRPGSTVELIAPALAVGIGQLETEAFAQDTDVVSVDLTQRVTVVISQGELGTFASNLDARYLAFTGQVLFAEDERCIDAAIVQSARSERLVHMKVYSATGPVVQDEVPGTVAGPRVDPIDSVGRPTLRAGLRSRVQGPRRRGRHVAGSVVPAARPPPSHHRRTLRRRTRANR